MGFFDSVGKMFENVNPLNAIGNIAGSLINADAQRKTNEANRRMAEDQMSFQQHNADTAHQREVKDLQAAGLNPILSAGGNGSATPAGASSTSVAPQISMPDFMAYGISLKQLEQADQKLALEKEANAAGIAKSLSETELNKMKKILAQKGMVRAELEGEAAQVMRNIIKFLKGSVNTPRKIQRQMETQDALPNRFQP